MTSDNLMKLQGLFRELFQLDMADLDFGLYRLFNIKRQEIEDFLTKQLPDEVDEAFRILSERDKTDFREGLQKLEEQIRDEFAALNLPFADWGNIFDSTTVATAIADRLVYNSQVLILQGESYRKRSRKTN